MKNLKIVFATATIGVATLCGCTTNITGTEKHQEERDNVIDVRDRIKEIDMGDVLISNIAIVNIIDDYLLINDHKSSAKLLHFFDKNTFKHVTSTVYKGQGPRELTIMGNIGVDEHNKALYINDHGKGKVLKYDLDSLLADPDYLPSAKMELEARNYPNYSQSLNDTLGIGFVRKIVKGHHTTSVRKWSTNIGEIEFTKYRHPDGQNKYAHLAASMKHNIYVECYPYYDLMTIYTLDGDLKWNIYGENWNTQVTEKIDHFSQVSFCNDKIVALYLGEESLVFDKNKKPEARYATKFLIFDINGDYIKTLETGYQITGFCVDQENNRIIMTLEDEMQFAYLALDGLLD